MQAEIITIGDEILIGQIIDTNSAYMGQELNKVGISVYQISSIQDEESQIRDALETANTRSQLVIITGGLGPTKDDVTKRVICDFFDDSLVKNEKVLAHIELLFKKYINVPISEMNRQQALVPSKATILHNSFGTAPGLWLEKNGSVFVFMPGVPYEMKGLMTKEVIPRVLDTFKRPFIIHRTILTYGWGESTIANTIEDWENNLPEPLKLAYLPSLGKVRLRISGKSFDKKTLTSEIEKQVKKLYPLIGDIIYGEEDENTIEEVIGKLLTQKQFTLATAESFTGGKIAEQLTAVPGASNYFKGAVVSYATETKIKLLGVDEDLIAKHSVVSEEVAVAMAKNVKEIIGTDFAIATTGNAGPSKGDSDVEVGTVFIAISTPERTFAQEFKMGKPRERVVRKSVNKAFEILYKEISNF
ncbi:CinA-like protein [Croceivirga lutea]|uniref:competence/damage-inducible protein A n=1 Tax=Croceivirga lutea TaxID=1775167 RepID=UPI001639CDBC|nr:competence/damage-inducible protein A [Croceivirga lutea]GGG57606.1 CinA-like protein [Croceivirga lutea]